MMERFEAVRSAAEESGIYIEREREREREREIDTYAEEAFGNGRVVARSKTKQKRNHHIAL